MLGVLSVNPSAVLVSLQAILEASPTQYCFFTLVTDFFRQQILLKSVAESTSDPTLVTLIKKLKLGESQALAK